MERKTILTSDNSKTLLIPELNETYHSTKGAMVEALYVFIQEGLFKVDKKAIKIFEMGFGTGLNALVTFNATIQKEISVDYHSIEKYPLSVDLIEELDHLNSLGYEKWQKEYHTMLSSPWNKSIEVHPNFKLQKLEGDLLSYQITATYDLIFFDAFGPKIQAKLWSEEVCQKMYDCLEKKGILVTYCAQGQFKRNLKSVGFEVESLPGPPGKREMTRAYKK